MSTASTLLEDVTAAENAIRRAIGPRKPTIGLVLGSGLGDFADTLTDAVAIDYSELSNFPVSRVAGHAGRLVAGKCGGKDVLAMQGRVHFYEGHELSQVVLPLRSMIRSGCNNLIITNAAGGVRPELSPGDLVAISDHLNLSGANPLVGDNVAEFGPRFPDMSHPYAPALRSLAIKAASDAGFSLTEGVYAMMSGPSYETPAEIRMLATIGADLVGMSTVPEVIVANHMGASVLGISCVTNKAAGLGGTLSHDEVKEAATAAKPRFVDLLSRVIAAL